jgi:AcrR family transcriptional regulator
MTAPVETTSAPPNSRRTGDELISAVHVAAFEEITEYGLRGASMDRIARRAGTGKAALYRRWPNVRALGLDVFLTTMTDAVPHSYPDTGSLRNDLLASMHSFTNILRGPMQIVLRELISETTHDPELVTEFRRRMAEPMDAELIGVLQRAMARGEIPTKPIDPFIFEIPDALVLHRLLINGEVIDEDSCARLIDSILIPLLERDS